MADKIIMGDAGKYAFCRDCQQNQNCDHSGSKLTARARYVFRYVFEFDSGVHIYPLPGSWENQMNWFDVMFTAGRSKLIEVRNDMMEKESKKAGRK